jgi:ABC-2 type transport system permease protein
MCDDRSGERRPDLLRRRVCRPVGQLQPRAGEQVSFFLINAVSFLNLGLAGFVVAAIAARLVFPGMSLEGRMIWLLRSSPLDVRTLFMTKYWVGTIPLMAVALPLIVLTNIILDATTLILVITFTMTALALGLGVLYPNYDTDNMAEIPTSFGGLVFMMAAVSYLGGVVILLAWPAYRFLLLQFETPGVTAGVLPLVLGASGALALTAVCIVMPLRAGVAKVRRLER